MLRLHGGRRPRLRCFLSLIHGFGEGDSAATTGIFLSRNASSLTHPLHISSFSLSSSSSSSLCPFSRLSADIPAACWSRASVSSGSARRNFSLTSEAQEERAREYVINLQSERARKRHESAHALVCEILDKDAANELDAPFSIELYHTMLNILCFNNNYVRANELFQRVLDKGSMHYRRLDLHMDERLLGLCHVTLKELQYMPELASIVFSTLQERNIEPNRNVYGALIASFARQRVPDVNMARALYESALSAGQATYVTFIHMFQMYYELQDVNGAMEVYRGMKEFGQNLKLVGQTEGAANPAHYNRVHPSLYFKIVQLLSRSMGKAEQQNNSVLLKSVKEVVDDFMSARHYHALARDIAWSNMNDAKGDRSALEAVEREVVGRMEVLLNYLDFRSGLSSTLLKNAALGGCIDITRIIFSRMSERNCVGRDEYQHMLRSYIVYIRNADKARGAKRQSNTGFQFSDEIQDIISEFLEKQDANQISKFGERFRVGAGFLQTACEALYLTAPSMASVKLLLELFRRTRGAEHEHRPQILQNGCNYIGSVVGDVNRDPDARQMVDALVDHQVGLEMQKTKPRPHLMPRGKRGNSIVDQFGYTAAEKEVLVLETLMDVYSLARDNRFLAAFAQYRGLGIVSVRFEKLVIRWYSHSMRRIPQSDVMQCVEAVTRIPPHELCESLLREVINMCIVARQDDAAAALITLRFEIFPVDKGGVEHYDTRWDRAVYDVHQAYVSRDYARVMSIWRKNEQYMVDAPAKTLYQPLYQLFNALSRVSLSSAHWVFQVLQHLSVKKFFNMASGGTEFMIIERLHATIVKLLLSASSQCEPTLMRDYLSVFMGGAGFVKNTGGTHVSGKALKVFKRTGELVPRLIATEVKALGRSVDSDLNGQRLLEAQRVAYILTESGAANIVRPEGSMWVLGTLMECRDWSLVLKYLDSFSDLKHRPADKNVLPNAMGQRREWERLLAVKEYYRVEIYRRTLIRVMEVATDQISEYREACRASAKHPPENPYYEGLPGDMRLRVRLLEKFNRKYVKDVPFVVLRQQLFKELNFLEQLNK